MSAGGAAEEPTQPTPLEAFKAASLRQETYLAIGVGGLGLLGLVATSLSEEGSFAKRVLSPLLTAGMFSGMWLAFLPGLVRVPPRPLWVEACYLGFYLLVLTLGAALCFDSPVEEALGELPFLALSPRTALVGGCLAAYVLTSTWLIRIRRQVRRLSAAEASAPEPDSSLADGTQDS